MYLYKKSLFIFRRDLRLHDNTALIQSVKHSESVIACFIFDPRQTTKQNRFHSESAVEFMVKSLQDLEKQLTKHTGKLFLFEGTADTVVQELINDEHIDAVWTNRDYTPFSITRDQAIKKVCEDAKIIFEQHEDALLNSPEKMKTTNGTAYTIFTPFFKKSVEIERTKPVKFVGESFFKGHIASAHSKNIYKKIAPTTNSQLTVQPGRTGGLKVLKNIHAFEHYKKFRDFPAQSTTHLSAHLKFGTLSVREVAHTITTQLGSDHVLIKQLYWRDFFTHIVFHFPRVLGTAFNEKYTHLSWTDNSSLFGKWCTGMTGFPLVDAGMRELNTTGFMHNRVRMVTASFLVKDLHIDWQKGEQYFAQQLVDYDPALNNGNWQWVASTGCDSQPYFRIFNPWLQQKKFDPECIYIKKWIPELAPFSPATIHTWYQEKKAPTCSYPRPLVDHAKESKYTKALYKKMRLVT